MNHVIYKDYVNVDIGRKFKDLKLNSITILVKMNSKKMGLKKAVQKIFKYLEILKKIHYYLFSNDFSLKTNNLFK